MTEAQRGRERLAVCEDRDRIACDLHDLVIQRLFAPGMMLESARRGSVAPEVWDDPGEVPSEEPERRAESLGGDSQHGPCSGRTAADTTVVWQAAVLSP